MGFQTFQYYIPEGTKLAEMGGWDWDEIGNSIFLNTVTFPAKDIHSVTTELSKIASEFPWMRWKRCFRQHKFQLVYGIDKGYLFIVNASETQFRPKFFPIQNLVEIFSAPDFVFPNIISEMPKSGVRQGWDIMQGIYRNGIPGKTPRILFAPCGSSIRALISSPGKLEHGVEKCWDWFSPQYASSPAGNEERAVWWQSRETDPCTFHFHYFTTRSAHISIPPSSSYWFFPPPASFCACLLPSQRGH